MEKTVRVRLLTSRCGPGLSQSPGDIVDCGEDEAMRLIESGQAAPVEMRTAEKSTSKKAKEAERR